MIAAVLSAVFVVGCSRPSTPGVSQLRTIILPDLSRMEPPVQAQMRDAYASLTRHIEDKQTAPDVLANAYGAMGNLFLAAEYLDAADSCYLNAQALAPGDVQWPYYLGHVYRTRGELAGAARSFERALELAPSDLATMVWLGNVYLDQGSADRAEPVFSKAISLAPASVAVLVGHGRTALAQHRFAQAVEAFEKALSIDPRASSIHYPVALAYRGLGEATKAEAHVRQRGTIEVGPPDPRLQAIGGMLHSAVSYEKLGIRALDGRDWASAAAAFRKAIELKPSEASLHHRLGTALSLAGDAAGAADHFQQAIRLAPSYAPPHFSLGVLFAQSGKDTDAVEQFSAALRAQPAYAEARLQLAGALIRLRRYDAARAQILEGMKHNPEREEFSRALGEFQRR